MPRSPSERNGRSRSASRSASHSPVERRRKRSRERTFSRDRSGSPNTSKRLHIANLDDSIRRRDIEDAFSKFGKLEDIWVASYPPLYAFVVFQNLEDATSALKEMRSGYIRDCHIRTTVALPRNSGRRGPPRCSGFRSRSPEYRRRRSPPAYRRRSRSRSPERRRRRSRS